MAGFKFDVVSKKFTLGVVVVLGSNGFEDILVDVVVVAKGDAVEFGAFAYWILLNNSSIVGSISLFIEVATIASAAARRNFLSSSS